MFGWMIVFALMAVLTASVNVAAGPAGALISMKLATAVFAFLFLACFLTSIVRGRA